MLIIGRNITLDRSQRKQIVDEVNKFKGLTKEQRLKLLDKYNGITANKDGTVTIK